MDYKARFYSPYLNHFIQPDSITTGGPQGSNRYSYVKNNPINFNDPTGHKPQCDADGYCGSNKPSLSPDQYLKKYIKSKYGITMSDDGKKPWTLQNLRLMNKSLAQINSALNGNLKSLAQGWTFRMQNQKGKGSYHGLTSTDGTMTIDFFTIGTDAIRQMNIFHEVGHLIDNVPGMENVFTRGVQARTWESLDGVYLFGGLNAGHINANSTLRDPNSVYDPNHKTAEAIQHESGHPSEQWADMFANYVAGNIDTSVAEGQAMQLTVSMLLVQSGAYGQ